MGVYTPKPYWQLNRATGKLRLVTPEPREFNEKVAWVHPVKSAVKKRGGRRV